MLEAAIRLVPAIAEAAVLSSWWGSARSPPTSARWWARSPMGCIVATGHGSEGVILGAGTAQLVAAQLAGDEPPFDPAPFDPLRFAAGAERGLSETQPSGAFDDRHDAIDRHREQRVAVAPHGRLRGDQRVHDRLLRRLDGGLEERGESSQGSPERSVDDRADVDDALAEPTEAGSRSRTRASARR